MKKFSEYIRQINEAQIYDGGEDLAKYICKLVKDNPGKDFFVINGKDLNFNNVFFKHLLIYVNENIKEELKKAQYIRGNSKSKTKATIGNLLKWNKEEKLFNFIEISLETTNKKDRDIDWTDLTHELNHAWDEYEWNLSNPDKEFLYDIDFDEYNTSQTLYNNAKNKYQAVIGYIKYVSVYFETKSFSVQATEKFKANLDKYSNFEEAINWQFEHNEVFNRFLLIKTWFDNFINYKSTKMLCNIYRENYKKQNNLSDDEIIQLISDLFDNFYKALTEDINKILDNYGKRNAL